MHLSLIQKRISRKISTASGFIGTLIIYSFKFSRGEKNFNFQNFSSLNLIQRQSYKKKKKSYIDIRSIDLIQKKKKRDDNDENSNDDDDDWIKNDAVWRKQ